MKKVAFYSKPLDDSNGTVKNEPNNAMQPASQTKKTPWHLRFAPGAVLRKSGIIAVLAIAGIAAVLTQGPVEKAEAASTNSLPTFSSLQEGDTIVSMKKKGKGETIRDWLRSIFGGAAGNQLTKKGQILEAQQAIASQAGKIIAYGGIVLSDVESEVFIWYRMSGEAAGHGEAGFDDYRGAKNRDYEFYDFHITRMKWNADDEIYEEDTEWEGRHYYSSRRGYDPDRINSRYNQGDVGVFWPEHEDYYKGKKGYLITWGTAQNLDLKHEMKSFISFPPPKARLLKVRASQHGKDKFEPVCYAWLSDMRYVKKNSTIGWTYTERTEPVEHKHELSAIVQTIVDLGDEFIPLNTRLESQTWEKNISTISWETVSTTVSSGSTGTISDGREIDLSGATVETRIPKQVISTWP